jgi:WD40 repeat protein/serine/threonine protein kinase
MNESVIFNAAAKLPRELRAAFLDQACGDDRQMRQEFKALLHAHDAGAGFLDLPAADFGAAPGARAAAAPHPAAGAPARDRAAPANDEAGPAGECADPAGDEIHLAETVTQPPLDEAPGVWIGPYKLLQKIGDGGMGTVWMAEQREPVRRMVALKVIRAGMDSAQVIAGFEAERQALALMDHPNIARVFDGGTTKRSPLAPREDSGTRHGPRNEDASDAMTARKIRPPLAEREGYGGRPYFVMELVKGTPITRYCDEHRLTIPDRLRLFVEVCHAVQHAHQKGIIHRDIKPSNVLVAPFDGRPVVKVIDFGVAKATGQKLTEKTMYTEFGAVVGTMQYMSPEQAELNNQDIDTRSDIYSLGVLLYELLTGTTPLDMNRLRGAALVAMLMSIKEDDPPKPSTRLSESQDSLPSISAQRQLDPAKLTKTLRGELDSIAMKALEKDRTRRFPTALELAADIERHLANEPVLACPPSVGYRLKKFTRKHRGPVTATVAFAVAVALGLTSAIILYLDANAAKQSEIKQRIVSEERREAAEEAEAKLRRLLYVSRMRMAQAAWENGDVDLVLNCVNEYAPDSPDGDLRGFEWFYWHRLCHRQLRTMRGVRGAFSPDGTRVATTDGDQVILWDIATGEAITSLRGTAGYVFGIAFSPDGTLIATAKNDRKVEVWDLRTGRTTATLEFDTTYLGGLMFSSDGSRIATADMKNHEVILWDVVKGQKITTLTGVNFAYSTDGGIASLSDDEMFKLLNLATGQKPATLKGFTGLSPTIAISPDGARIAVAPDVYASNNDHTVRISDTSTGQEIATLRGHTRPVHLVKFSPDGSHIATASWDGTVKVWDPSNGHEDAMLKGHRLGITDVAFSPDSARIVTASGDRTVKLWDLARGQRPFDGISVCTLKGHTGDVTDVEFSSDGTHILSSSNHDRTVRLWDVPPPEFAYFPQVGSTCTLFPFARSVAIAPNGARIGIAFGRATFLLNVATWQAITAQQDQNVSEFLESSAVRLHDHEN